MNYVTQGTVQVMLVMDDGKELVTFTINPDHNFTVKHGGVKSTSFS